MAKRLILPALALLACALVASTWHVFGNVWDEPEHIAAGMSLLDRDQYLYDDQHPPLARLAAALGPHLAGARLRVDASPSGVEAGRDILYKSKASYDTLLTLARLGMLPFLIVLIFALWRWARDNHGEPVAWLSTLFLVSTPAILGHAGVVALDVPVTALCVLSFYFLQRWIAAPTAQRGAALGLAAGLAVSTKMSALPFIGIAAVVLLTMQIVLNVRQTRLAPGGPSTPTPASRASLLPGIKAYIGSAALAALLVFIVCVAVYGPHLIYLTTPGFKPNRALDALVGDSGRLHELAYNLAAHWRVPLGVQEVVLNILGVEFHNLHGHPAYLLGQTDLLGWWYFYPVALSVKTPIPMLVLGIPGLIWTALHGWRERRLASMTPALIFAALLTFCCLYSHINIGVRHVLVLYPLLAIGAAAASVALWNRLRARWARSLLGALLLWQIATVVSAYPDYLAYFNGFAGAHPEHILVDSDLDWGQDLRRLSLELARRRVPSLHIAYRGSADLSREHLPPYQLLVRAQRVTGWIAIDMLAMKESGDGYAWLSDYQPVQRVGKSIDLYYLPTH
jgi:4-amino-4-deoxy-L-arabinose transferase-like glycosyltransferase